MDREAWRQYQNEEDRLKYPEAAKRHAEIWANHRIDPLVQQAAWDSVWDFLLERAIDKLRAEGKI